MFDVTWVACLAWFVDKKWCAIDVLAKCMNNPDIAALKEVQIKNAGVFNCVHKAATFYRVGGTVFSFKARKSTQF